MAQKEGYVKKTVIIPESEIPTFTALVENNGWKEAGIGEKMKRLKETPRKGPFLSDQEIVAEVKAYRYGR